ncbi:amino acid ABC transporter membrane protein, PAAT family [Microbispora rosea]|uniref:Amino acid ABC transporter membrane protein, PAAT family n=1 Tax=Microbispora rosea TaxID=58117 RepID=A0A1N7HJ40_9ACTN|nr:amino acid ABC transporter permease [Microbispora rosea]GIH52908.1 putative amino acid ABC transporter, permease protein [Microbispora rosea subsp. rosea]SIS24688.1 amino acid ABC transporter membrane protein, PAAT family [Microbispora rosea]
MSVAPQTAAPQAGAPQSVDVAAARPRVRPLRWVAGAVLLVLVAQFAWFLVTNPRFEWPVAGTYLFDPNVLRGLGMTLLLTVIVMLLGSVLGVLLAAGRLSGFRPVAWACGVYVTVFRSIPPLVQLIFWFNLGYLLPRIPLGIPFGPTFVSWPTNSVISSLTAAVIGLTLHEAAYMAEIVRAGILAVDGGQRDAARAMGFTARQSFVKVVLPQAMRVIVPPAGSEFISLLKGTSLVSVIAMADLLYSVQVIYNRTYEIVPLLIVACAWYLVVVISLSFGQRRLERHFGKGQR